MKKITIKKKHIIWVLALLFIIGMFSIFIISQFYFEMNDAQLVGSIDGDYSGGTLMNSISMDGASIAADYNFDMNKSSSDYNSDTEISSIDEGESVSLENNDSNNENNNDNNNAGSKIIVTISTTIETLEYEKAVKVIEEKTKSVKGYMESSDIEGTSIRDEEDRYKYRNAKFTIRVPKDKVDEFNKGISEAGKIVENVTESEDVSATYFDKEARLETLKIQENRLLDILSKSTKLEDILELEKRLSDVRYEIESITTTLNKINNLVDYTTINVSIRETHKLEESIIVTETSFLDEIKYTFKQTISGFIYLIKTIILMAISLSPYIIITILIYMLLKRRVRKFVKKYFNLDELLLENNSEFNTEDNLIEDSDEISNIKELKENNDDKELNDISENE